MRFVIFSDLHLHNNKAFGGVVIKGLNKRAKYTLKGLKQVEDYLIENKISYMVFSGDWFIDRVKPDFVLVNRVRAWLLYLSQLGITIIFVHGNHDQYAGDENGEYIFKDLETAFYRFTKRDRRKNNILYYRDCCFVVTPFIKDEKELRKLMLDCGKHLKKKGYGWPVILLGHTPVFHATTPSGYKFPFGVLLNGLRKYYTAGFFGDNHKYQKLRKGFYSVGSLLQHDFGDVGDKRGFLDVKVINKKKVKVKFIPIKAPEFKIVTFAEVMAHTYKGIEDNNYYRIICKEQVSDKADAWIKKMFKNFEYVYNSDTGMSDVNNMKGIAVDKREVFEAFVKENSKGDKFRFNGNKFRKKLINKRGVACFD